MKNIPFLLFLFVTLLAAPVFGQVPAYQRNCLSTNVLPNGADGQVLSTVGGVPFWDVSPTTNFVSLYRYTLFVDAAYGNDSTAQIGLPSKSWATIGGAMSSAVSGNTISVLNGTFSESVVVKSNVSLSLAQGVVWNQPASAPAVISASGGQLTVLGSGTFNASSTTNFFVLQNDANVSGVTFNGSLKSIFWLNGTNQTLTFTATTFNSEAEAMMASSVTNLTLNVYADNVGFNGAFGGATNVATINIFGASIVSAGVVMTNATVNAFEGSAAITGITFINWRFHDTRLKAAPSWNPAFTTIGGDATILP